MEQQKAMEYGSRKALSDVLKPHYIYIYKKTAYNKMDNVGNTVSNKEKVLQRWSEYYEKHFELQDGTDSGSGEGRTMCIQTAEPYVEPPNDADIEMEIRKLKNGKATGNDQNPVKLIKGAGWGGSSRRSFTNLFKKYGRKRSYHVSGNMA